MKYFGTDGIRGTYGEFEISEPFFVALGKATADWLAENGSGKIVVGGDTRASTDVLKSAFCDGLKSGGAQFEDLGVLPTPALAYGVLARNAKMGAMITASHNPYTDNGIKFFDGNARKVEDDMQEWLEARLEKYLPSFDSYKPQTFEPRKIEVGKFALEEYAKKMSSIFPKDFLKGVKGSLFVSLYQCIGESEGVGLGRCGGNLPYRVTGYRRHSTCKSTKGELVYLAFEYTHGVSGTEYYPREGVAVGSYAVGVEMPLQPRYKLCLGRFFEVENIYYVLESAFKFTLPLSDREVDVSVRD